MPKYVIVAIHDDAFGTGKDAHPKTHEHVVRALESYHQDVMPRTVSGEAPPNPVQDIFPIYDFPGVVIDPKKMNIIQMNPGSVVRLHAPADFLLRLHEMYADTGNMHTFEVTLQPIADSIAEMGFDPRPQIVR